MMAILQFTFLPKNVTGQLEIANMVMKMADLDADAEFDYNSTELTDRLLQCATHVLPYFSNQVHERHFFQPVVSATPFRLSQLHFVSIL